MTDLSILIPARNEEFLARTVQDILENIEANTEIIVVLDGETKGDGIPQNDRVNVILLNESIGQRAATNLACRLSRSKYVMKVDAHCAFDKGFDRKLIEDMDDNWTVVPIMRNLHAFDWKCFHCGKKWYQDVTVDKCDQCGKSDKIEKKMLWRGKRSPNSSAYLFNSQLEFKYFDALKHKQTKDLEETMSLQGSCFMATRENYWERELCDESWGSWGGQGAEVAIKTWLSGGKVMVNKKTWYAHMFRTKSGFGFPYANPGNEQKRAKDKLRDTFLNDKWEKQVHPLSWLVKKFWPVPGWTQEELDKLKV